MMGSTNLSRFNVLTFQGKSSWVLGFECTEYILELGDSILGATFVDFHLRALFPESLRHGDYSLQSLHYIRLWAERMADKYDTHITLTWDGGHVITVHVKVTMKSEGLDGK